MGQNVNPRRSWRFQVPGKEGAEGLPFFGGSTPTNDEGLQYPCTPISQVLGKDPPVLRTEVTAFDES